MLAERKSWGFSWGHGVQKRLFQFMTRLVTVWSGGPQKLVLLWFPKRKCKILLILSPCTYCVKMKGWGHSEWCWPCSCLDENQESVSTNSRDFSLLACCRMSVKPPMGPYGWWLWDASNACCTQGSIQHSPKSSSKSSPLLSIFTRAANPSTPFPHVCILPTYPCWWVAILSDLGLQMGLCYFEVRRCVAMMWR